MNKSITNLSVVIACVKKDKKYLKNCLLSLEKSASIAKVKLEIQVVANGTKIQPLHFLHSYYQIHSLQINIGFGQAINYGMKFVRDDWVILLAPDTRLYKNTIFYLIKYLKDKRIALIGPKTILQNGKLDFTIQPDLNIYNLFLELSYLYKILPGIFRHPFASKEMYEYPHEVKSLVSTFWMIRRECFYNVGGFDQRFFLYFEDTDFCIRLVRKKMRIIYDPSPVIRHFSHKSVSPQSSGNLIMKSYYIFLSKYHGKTYVLIAFLILIWGNLLKILIFILISPRYKNEDKLEYLKENFKTGLDILFHSLLWN